jgi:hypothetical protein
MDNLINAETGFASSRDAPCRRSSRHGTPNGSLADESGEAKRKVVPLANVFGSGARDDRPASVSGALRDAVRSSRYHNARPNHGPSGRCRRLCHRSIVSCHGRPRPSVRPFGRKMGSISSHWASPSSHRPRIPPFCLLSHALQIAKEGSLNLSHEYGF